MAKAAVQRLALHAAAEGAAVTSSFSPNCELLQSHAQAPWAYAEAGTFVKTSPDQQLMLNVDGAGGQTDAAPDISIPPILIPWPAMPDVLARSRDKKASPGQARLLLVRSCAPPVMTKFGQSEKRVGGLRWGGAKHFSTRHDESVVRSSPPTSPPPSRNNSRSRIAKSSNRKRAALAAPRSTTHARAPPPAPTPPHHAEPERAAQSHRHNTNARRTLLKMQAGARAPNSLRAQQLGQKPGVTHRPAAQTLPRPH